MAEPRNNWATQQLAEFMAAVSAPSDEEEALRIGVERAAEVLEAEAVALVRGGEAVVALGWPRIDVPERDLAAVAAAGGGTVPVPGAGPTAVRCFALDGEPDTHLVVGRVHAPLQLDELTLLRGMARTLALTVRLLRTIAAERHLRARSDQQARENARLLEGLRKRQRMQEALTAIQRAISHRAPLSDVLERIVVAATDLLGGTPSALLLADTGDLRGLAVVADCGFEQDAVLAARLRAAGDGIAARAAAEGRLIVVEDYQHSAGEYVDSGVQAAMAAPVHENGVVIGSLVVSSFATRTFSRAEQDTLLTFAEHASLALTDARTVNAMLHQSLHDALTGLPNRALFADRLEHALVQGMRRGTTSAVMFLDVDRFKAINESLGHAAGDDLIIEVARRLDTTLRAADTAARLGGDEFALLLEDLSGPEEAMATAARIIQAMRVPVAVTGRDVYVSLSMGVALADGSSGEQLMRRADVALDRAKVAGPVALFEPAMQTAVVERMELEGDLQHALERGELVVHYQPVISLTNGRLAGFEALVRWRHPTRGLVPPFSFIPLAEDTGQIVELGRHVLRAACRQFKLWAAAFDAEAEQFMSVNLSGRQLMDEGIVEDVRAALEESGLDPGALVLEITETVLMQDTEATIARLQALRALGVKLAIDDFGTGYSSLRYLRRFPVDALKMAKPFVDGLGAGEEGLALARAIVELSSSLHIRCVAEGIEREGQVTQLRELGCGLGQGFHFARPMAAADLETLLLSDDRA